MKRIAFVVEGATEEFFVNRILRGELTNAELTVVNLKGGGFSLPAMLRHITPLLYAKFSCITTMVDLHRFRNPGHKSDANGIQRELEDAVNAVNRSNTMFLPYVQKHEFEALLFADRQAISGHLQLKAEQHKKLQSITGAPEDINHGKPPSKWLGNIYSRYDKLIDGIEIARNIGLPKITRECPHFAGWLVKLKEAAKQ